MTGVWRQPPALERESRVEPVPARHGKQRPRSQERGLGFEAKGEELRARCGICLQLTDACCARHGCTFAGDGPGNGSSHRIAKPHGYKVALRVEIVLT